MQSRSQDLKSVPYITYIASKPKARGVIEDPEIPDVVELVLSLTVIIYVFATRICSICAPYSNKKHCIKTNNQRLSGDRRAASSSLTACGVTNKGNFMIHGLIFTLIRHLHLYFVSVSCDCAVSCSNIFCVCKLRKPLVSLHFFLSFG